MSIYVDVLIFTNIIINYCILSLTRKFLQIKTTELRIILASLVGALFSLSVLLGILPAMLSLSIKLISTFTMCSIAFTNNNHNVAVYLKSVFFTFVFSFILCGIILAVHNVTQTDDIAVINDTVYFCVDSISLIITSISTYIIITFVQKIFNCNIENTIVNLKITIENQEYSCVGKIDTACTVTEPFTGAPVIIAENSMFKSIEKPFRVIPYKALGSQGIMNGVKAQQIIIDNKVVEKDVYIGLFDGKIDPQFKAIINHNIMR